MAHDTNLEDIEDIIAGAHETDIRSGNKKHVVPKARRFKPRSPQSEVYADSIIPGMNHYGASLTLIIFFVGAWL